MFRAHAGLFSKASDLQVLIDLMLHDGTYNGKKFIKPEVVGNFTIMDRFRNVFGWEMDHGRRMPRRQTEKIRISEEDSFK